MSFTLSASGPSRQALARGFSTSSSVAGAPVLSASLLLSRTPLLTPTPQPFEKAYYERNFKIRHALSNPVSTDFYFKTGSLAMRRFLGSEHELERKFYGDKLAGPKPKIGDVPPEPAHESTPRDHWVKADEARGEKSLERCPEEELFCLVQTKGKWTFPSTDMKIGEALDAAVTRITGLQGSLDGKTMDTWLVTRKPVGLVRDGDKRNFFMRSHILAGEPKPTKESGISSWAWLTAEEVEDRLRKQGDEKLWESVKGMFGVSEQEL